MNHLIIKYSLLIGMIVMLRRCSNSTFQIDADFPGGNVMVVDIDGDSIRLQQDLRDTNNYSFK